LQNFENPPAAEMSFLVEQETRSAGFCTKIRQLQNAIEQQIWPSTGGHSCFGKPRKTHGFWFKPKNQKPKRHSVWVFGFSTTNLFK
jgi:hypothetical protein